MNTTLAKVLTQTFNLSWLDSAKKAEFTEAFTDLAEAIVENELLCSLSPEDEKVLLSMTNNGEITYIQQKYPALGQYVTQRLLHVIRRLQI